ncbi:MAG TPA: hypothetical protein VII94_03480 [Candidatus Saccharimonadales bacterium]
MTVQDMVKEKRLSKVAFTLAHNEISFRRKNQSTTFSVLAKEEGMTEREYFQYLVEEESLNILDSLLCRDKTEQEMMITWAEET